MHQTGQLFCDDFNAFDGGLAFSECQVFQVLLGFEDMENAQLRQLRRSDLQLLEDGRVSEHPLANLISEFLDES